MSSKKSATGNIFFGGRLREARKALKVRLVDLSEKIGVGHSFLSQVERGDKSLSLEKLMLLTETLEIDYHWLLTGKGEMFRETADTVQADGLSEEERKLVNSHRHLAPVEQAKVTGYIEGLESSHERPR